MQDPFVRTRMLLGDDAMEKLAGARVAVFGIGGVGGYTAEALARSGIGELDLIDNDTVAISNLNRQIIATRRTIGTDKVDAAEERIREIDPRIIVHKHKVFFLPEEHGDIEFEKFDYVVDAVDTVTAKLAVIAEAQKRGIPVISAMGCGNRLDPAKLCVTDIYKTEGDPLARVLRKKCREYRIRKLQVVYSTEPPIRPLMQAEEENTAARAQTAASDGSGKAPTRKDIPGSAIFVPAAAGLLIASVVCRELAGKN